MWSPTSTSSSAPYAAACSESRPAAAATAMPSAARQPRSPLTGIASLKSIVTEARLTPHLLFHSCSRQFGHRVKGVSMSTFKPEEVQALAESGNAVRAAWLQLVGWAAGPCVELGDAEAANFRICGYWLGGWSSTCAAA